MMATASVFLCEANLRDTCPNSCNLPHSDLPYLWMVREESSAEWICLNWEDCAKVEVEFCKPEVNHIITQVVVPERSGPAVRVEIAIDFNNMLAKITYKGSTVFPVAVQRLATRSYGYAYLALAKDSQAEEQQEQSVSTQWRWYYKQFDSWRRFETDDIKIMQSVIETKYLAGQEVFRFVMPSETAANKKVYLLNFTQKCVEEAGTSNRVEVRRRPLFAFPDMIKSKMFLPSPEWKPSPYLSELPEQWYPWNPSDHYELVPLNPDSMDFNLVASELIKSLPSAVIRDIFRVQNPYLWHKYTSKKKFMQQHGSPLNELQVFHGTPDSHVVQSILWQNFDWRMSGKNATVYGKGSYFALNASFSHKYTGIANPFRWMFLARVLTGRSAKGHRDYARPPPLDPSTPYGAIFDSCVDNTDKANIYVIFDSDQCYPEYLISYT